MQSEDLKRPRPKQQSKVAYMNPKFMESDAARTLRIAAEYLEPQVRLRRYKVQNTVVFFGSARLLPRDVAKQRLGVLETSAANGNPHQLAEEIRTARMAVEMARYYEEARELARKITEWSRSLNRGDHFLVVCSGGGPGIMEAANRGASEAGGVSIGLNIKLPFEQSSNPYVTPELNFLFRYFFMRKLWFAQPARTLIAFPGGYGTMDELWELLTLIQTHKLGHHAIVLLYGTKFWKRLIDFEWMKESGVIAAEDLNLIHFAESPPEAFDILEHSLRRNRAMRAAFEHPFP
jgi:uncharacterized protein (TIGR00730 family)